MTSTPRYDREQIAALTRQGKTAAQIAELLGCTERTVSRVRIETGTAKPVSPYSGKPVSPERLEQARLMLNDGAPWSEISRTLHISEHSLAKHFPGTQWTREQMNDLSAAIQRARWATR